ncbi:hypothetical protein C8J56DRAFT_1065187 [Mycena floridula]|nr:hypothetical protein C8J56DRAFT_1065187 [Mycena floridula]
MTGLRPAHHVVFCQFSDSPNYRSRITRTAGDAWVLLVEPADTGRTVKNMFWEVMKSLTRPPRALWDERPHVYAKFSVDPLALTYRPMVMYFCVTECKYDIAGDAVLIVPEIIVEEVTHKVYTVIPEEGMLLGYLQRSTLPRSIAPDFSVHEIANPGNLFSSLHNAQIPKVPASSSVIPIFLHLFQCYPMYDSKALCTIQLTTSWQIYTVNHPDLEPYLPLDWVPDPVQLSFLTVILVHHVRGLPDSMHWTKPDCSLLVMETMNNFWIAFPELSLGGFPGITVDVRVPVISDLWTEAEMQKAEASFRSIMQIRDSFGKLVGLEFDRIYKGNVDFYKEWAALFPYEM